MSDRHHPRKDEVYWVHDATDIGDVIRHFRHITGITHMELANRTGIPHATPSLSVPHRRLLLARHRSEGMAEQLHTHRLIMFVGTPGAGKSTLSRWLWRQLVAGGVSATLLPEEEAYPLEALQPFSKAFPRADSADIPLLLDGVRALCSAWDSSGSAWITDQFLPAFHWLFGIYPPDTVRAYAEELLSIIAPLYPLLVSLEADGRNAWQRAVAERGQEWSDWMVDIFSRRNLPLYPGEPIRDLDTLLQFLTWIDSQCRTLVARWPIDTVNLDTERTPLDRVTEILLQRAYPSHVHRRSPQDL